MCVGADTGGGGVDDEEVTCAGRKEVLGPDSSSGLNV